MAAAGAVQLRMSAMNTVKPRIVLLDQMCGDDEGYKGCRVEWGGCVRVSVSVSVSMMRVDEDGGKARDKGRGRGMDEERKEGKERIK